MTESHEPAREPDQGGAPAPEVGRLSDGQAGDPSSAQPPVPRVLCDTGAVTAAEPVATGALWKLTEPGRQLDSNLVHLRPGQSVKTHAEPELDVLLLVVAGGGALRTVRSELALTEGVLTWLPRGSSRSLTAGDAGLSYLTVHRRRPGMQIRRRGDVDGGSAP